MTVATTIRMDEKLKKDASALCEAMGLSFNAFVVMATTQLVNQKRIPFDIYAPGVIPTDKTYRAMIEAEAKELGLLPDNSPRFQTVGDAIMFLED